MKHMSGYGTSGHGKREERMSGHGKLKGGSKGPTGEALATGAIKKYFPPVR